MPNGFATSNLWRLVAEWQHLCTCYDKIANNCPWVFVWVLTGAVKSVKKKWKIVLGGRGLLTVAAIQYSQALSTTSAAS